MPSRDPAAKVTHYHAEMAGAPAPHAPLASNVGAATQPQGPPDITPVDDPVALHPAAALKMYDAAIRDVVVREDPVVDGWDSERFAEQADAQLKQLGKLLSHPEDLDGEHAEPLCSPRFQSDGLRPAKLTIVYRGPDFEVRRPQSEPQTDGASAENHAGLEGFLFVLRQQSQVLRGAADVDFKFKIIRVQLDGGDATTTAYFQIHGTTPRGRVQVNATWDCLWEAGGTSESPRLRAIRATDYEEVACQEPAGRPFADCTESALTGLPALDEQLAHGRDHWYGNLEATLGVEGRGNGIAVGDVNGDGLDDVYICQPAALPNRLFVRNADGSLRDMSAEAAVDWLDSSRGALLVDVDNDGDQDLLLAQRTDVLLHENDGAGRFTLRGIVPTDSLLFSMNAVDYDNDGDLDLFVCGYTGASGNRPEDIFASPMPYHDANNGAQNVMLRNDGNWRFSDVTAAVGLDANNLRFSLASAWDDYDNDGDMDLYVANDFGRNNLYRNDNGRFVDVAAEAGVEDIGPGMSAAFGDYNNDGRMDIYVSNMFSSAGSRITHNPQFKPGAGDADLAGFRRHARGNTLFENLGDGTFADRAVESGTTMGRWAWGSLFVDLNNDGHRDIYVTNGFVTADDNNDL